MRRTCAVLPLLALAAGSASPVRGQLPGGVSLSVEAAPMVAVAAGQFAGTEPGLGAGVGIGVGADVILRRGPVLGLYGGYAFTRFACGECREAGLEGLADLGWEVGVQLTSPVTVGGVRPWLRGGILAHQLRVTGHESAKSSPLAGGVIIATGIDLPFHRFLVAPGVRFSTFPAEFDFATLPGRSTQVTSLTAGVGLAYRL